MRTNNSSQGAAEHELRSFERLVAQGSVDAAELALEIYGPNFGNDMGPAQLERKRAALEKLNELRAPDAAETSGGPGFR